MVPTVLVVFCLTLRARVGGTLLQSPLRLPGGLSVFGLTGWIPASWHVYQSAIFVFAGLVIRSSRLPSSPVHCVVSKRPDSAPQPGGSIPRRRSIRPSPLHSRYDREFAFAVQTRSPAVRTLNDCGTPGSGLHRGHRLGHCAIQIYVCGSGRPLSRSPSIGGPWAIHWNPHQSESGAFQSKAACRVELYLLSRTVIDISPCLVKDCSVNIGCPPYQLSAARTIALPSLGPDRRRWFLGLQGNYRAVRPPVYLVVLVTVGSWSLITVLMGIQHCSFRPALAPIPYQCERIYGFLYV